MTSKEFRDAWDEAGDAMFEARCLVAVAHDLGREDPYLGSSNQDAMNILTLIRVAGEKLALATERQEDVWRAAAAVTGNETKERVDPAESSVRN